MTTKTTKYDFPNLGCLLGTAYQMQSSMLSMALKEEGLDILPAEYMILRALYCNRSMQQCEITRLIGKDKAAVSRTVAGLALKGYISVEMSGPKCSIVSLTERGEEIRESIMSVAYRCQNSLSEILTKDELETFKNTLNKIVNQK